MSRKQARYQKFKEKLKLEKRYNLDLLECLKCKSQFLLNIPIEVRYTDNSFTCGKITCSFSEKDLTLEVIKDTIGRDFCRIYGDCKVSKDTYSQFPEHNKDSFVKIAQEDINEQEHNQSRR